MTIPCAVSGCSSPGTFDPVLVIPPIAASRSFIPLRATVHLAHCQHHRNRAEPQDLLRHRFLTRFLEERSSRLAFAPDYASARLEWVRARPFDHAAFTTPVDTLLAIARHKDASDFALPQDVARIIDET